MIHCCKEQREIQLWWHRGADRQREHNGSITPHLSYWRKLARMHFNIMLTLTHHIKVIVTLNHLYSNYVVIFLHIWKMHFTGYTKKIFHSLIFIPTRDATWAKSVISISTFFKKLNFGHRQLLERKKKTNPLPHTLISWKLFSQLSVCSYKCFIRALSVNTASCCTRKLGWQEHLAKPKQEHCNSATKLTNRKMRAM